MLRNGRKTVGIRADLRPEARGVRRPPEKRPGDGETEPGGCRGLGDGRHRSVHPPDGRGSGGLHPAEKGNRRLTATVNRSLPGRLLLSLSLLAILCAAVEVRSESAFDQEKCSLCHIRDSVFFSASFLSADALKGFDEARLCGSCHNGSVQDDRAQLWRGAQHPDAGGGRGKRCSRCHSPHSKGGWGVLAGTSVSLRSGGDALCTGCHAQFQGRTTALHE